MDRASVYTVIPPGERIGTDTFEGDTNVQVQAQLETFILDFRLENVFVYRSEKGFNRNV